MEIIPVNFYQRSFKEQNSITETFKGFFRIAPGKVHFKVRTEETDISRVIYNIRESNKNETDPMVKEQVDDYINNIRAIQTGDTLCQKFYVIYEYEGDINGKKSNDMQEIAMAMNNTREHLKGVFRSAGNLVADVPNEAFHVCDILYKFFNPNSSLEEPLELRMARINNDAERYNASVPEKKQREVEHSDYIAPRGIDVRHHDYVVVDGQYHTFIMLRDNGYPGRVNSGWIDGLGKGKGIDIDIISTRLNHDRTLSALEQYNRITRVRANNNQFNTEKFEDMARSVNNVSFVTTSMKTGDEDLFDVMIIITVRDNDYKSMMYTRDSLIKKLQSRSLYTNDSYMNAAKLYRMTMPFMNVSAALFNRCKHNFLTSSMASLYCFTAYELFDETGYVLGTNAVNNTLVAINNFNTKRYANANILVLGTSGSGKTYTTEMIAYRMRMQGVRTIFILPTKGREDYLGGCQNIHGTFITLSPSSPHCVNIMAIRPEASLKEESYTDGDDPDFQEVSKLSLLSSKITSVIVFIQLLMGDEKMTLEEESQLGIYISELYGEFGITNSNSSIWEDRENGILKQMPVIGDLYQKILDEPKLSRIASLLALIVKGDYKSLNRQTNVDLTNKYIVFDIDDATINERMLPAFLYVAFDCAYSMAKENNQKMDAVFMDEVWKMMTNDRCAKQVKQMVKLIRAYGSCVVITTQDIEDFLGKQSEFGASVLNNTEIKIFMKLTEKEVRSISEYMDFTDEDKKTLMNLYHQGMIFSNGDKVICNFISSDREQRAFTTDINLRRQYAEEKRQKALAERKAADKKVTVKRKKMTQKQP